MRRLSLDTLNQFLADGILFLQPSLSSLSLALSLSLSRIVFLSRPGPHSRCERGDGTFGALMSHLQRSSALLLCCWAFALQSLLRLLLQLPPQYSMNVVVVMGVVGGGRRCPRRRRDLDADDSHGDVHHQPRRSGR